MTSNPTTMTASILALINSIVGGGVVLHWWNLSADQVAAMMLIFGNLFIVLGALFVSSHTVSLKANRESVAVAAAAPPDAPALDGKGNDV